jgi:5'-nucleotidase
LVTNDDGIASPGLHVLAAAIAEAGHDVVVVAPSSDRSGVGAALGLVHADQHLDIERVELPGYAHLDAYSLDGPPGMCAVAGRLGAFGEPPELVASGINAGLNTGRAILHSGTVGAALTAQNFGCSGLAVSTSPRDGVSQWR